MNQNGTAFCPHCHATNEDRRKVQQQLIQQPTHTPRTTATQSYDHERLIANGNNHADAKLYNNVMHSSRIISIAVGTSPSRQCNGEAQR